MIIEIECPECDGTGYIFNGGRDTTDENNYEECNWCCGNGVVYEKYEVNE